MTAADRRRLRNRSWLAPVALIVVLAGAVALRPGDEAGALQLANPDLTRVRELRALVSGLPDAPLVLVGVDPDLGTYPEIRVAVRTVLDDLLAEGARVAFVSFTPEGRAVASAELDRLRRGRFGETRLLDLGFIAGAEAGMVLAVTDLLPAGSLGPVAEAISEADGGMAAFDLAVVVGGTEIGPRTWIEQVGTRLSELPIAAIVPTFAQPELAPYLRTGQLAALLATVRDGAAYVAEADRTSDSGTAQAERVPSALAMLLGMVVALAVLGRSVASGLWGAPGPAAVWPASVPRVPAGRADSGSGGGVHEEGTGADLEADTDHTDDVQADDAEPEPDDVAPSDRGRDEGASR